MRVGVLCVKTSATTTTTQSTPHQHRGETGTYSFTTTVPPPLTSTLPVCTVMPPVTRAVFVVDSPLTCRVLEVIFEVTESTLE